MPNYLPFIKHRQCQHVFSHALQIALHAVNWLCKQMKTTENNGDFVARDGRSFLASTPRRENGTWVGGADSKFDLNYVKPV